MEIVSFGCALTHGTVRLKFYCPTEWKNGERWTLRRMRKYPRHSAVHVNVGTYFECNRKSSINTSDQFLLCNRKRRLYCARDIFDWLRLSCRTLAYKHSHTLTRAHTYRQLQWLMRTSFSQQSNYSVPYVYVNVEHNPVAVVERVRGAHFFNPITQVDRIEIRRKQLVFSRRYVWTHSN